MERGQASGEIIVQKMDKKWSFLVGKAEIRRSTIIMIVTDNILLNFM
jgi:hypothetical protein